MSIAENIFPDFKFEQLLISENCYSALTWNYNLELLFDDSTIDPTTRFELILSIEDPIMRMHQTLHFLEHLTSISEIDFAKEVVESLHDIDASIRTKDTRSLGHRKILNYYAEQADFEAFSKTIKLCEPAKERSNLLRIKANFVTCYSKKYPLEDTLKIVGNKLFGSKLMYAAIEPATEKMSYQAMKKTIEKHQQLRDLEHSMKVQMLAETFYFSSKTEYSLGDFHEIYQLVFDLDPKISGGDVKLRDWLLMQIGSNLKELDLVTQCRKAIKNNRLKKELSAIEKSLK